jgi:hypothetical protein
MERLTCNFCGLPFRAPTRAAATAPVFCCSGCALASQLGIGGGKFPITPQLLFDLGFAFGVFNEFLLGLLAVALRHEARAPAAAFCLVISVGLGASLYLAALAWQWRARWLRASDVFVFALAAGPVLAGLALAWAQYRGLGAASAAGANLGLTLWSARGFLRRWWARRAI